MKQDNVGLKQNLSQKILKNVAWNFAGNGVVLIITILATPYIVRSLAVDLYGVYALIGVVIGYFSFLQFGLGVASVKYISQHYGEHDEELVRTVFWSYLAAFVVIGIIGMCIIAFSAPLLVDKLFRMPQELKEVAVLAFRLGSVGFLVSTVMGVTSGAVQAVGRFDILNRVGVVLGALQVILTVILLKLGLSLAAIIISNIIVQALGLVIYWIAAMRLMPYLAVPSVRLSVLGRLFRYGGFVTVTSVVNPILMNIEKIFLTAVCSVACLTYYSVPYALVAKLSIVPAMLSSVIFPTFSTLQASGEEEMTRDLNYRSTLYLFFLYAFFALFFLFFGRSFISVWMGNDFAVRSSGVLYIMAVAGLISATAQPSFTALQGLGKPYIPAIFHAAELVIYIPLSYFCIKRLGITGAALAWLIRVAVDAVLLQKVTTGLFGQSVRSWYARLFRTALPPVMAAAILFLGLRQAGLPFFHPLNIAGLFLIFACYLFLVWKWGLDDFAKDNIGVFVKGLCR